MSKEIFDMMKCIDIKENEDGSAEILFNVDDNFKEVYKKTFGLKKWSQKHFDNLVVEAISNFQKTIKKDDT